jgi:hypothetical protein
LADLLRSCGYEAEVVDVIPRDAAATIVLVDSQDGADANVRAFQAAQSVAARFRKAPGVFVLIRDAANPWSGGFSGLARTAALEWPGARVKSIDIECAGRNPRDVAAALLQELVAGGPEIEIALTADGRRSQPIAMLAPARGGKGGIGPESVLVVSGGARGVTARCVIELARRTGARMLLLGRSEPSGSEIDATLRALADAGSPARYAQADVRDRKALDAAISGARREWGAVTGLIHGAGVLADARIENLSLERFDAVFSTKVVGLRNLLDATQSEPISVLCVFSSWAAFSYNAGQAA